MQDDLSDEELLAYLDELLPANRSAEVEAVLRRESRVRQRAALLSRRRDSGAHSIGEIWRRRQISCPNRETLGMYLLGVVDTDLEDYIAFHIDLVGCRICSANLADLKSQQNDATNHVPRRTRYFESSAGVLRARQPETDR